MSEVNLLLNEQHRIILGVRNICSNVISIVEEHLESTLSKIKTLGGDVTKQLHPKDDRIMPLFFKISALLLKIIPIEQKLKGTKIVEDLETAQKMEIRSIDDTPKISDEDIEILKEFLNQRSDTNQGTNQISKQEEKNHTKKIKRQTTKRIKKGNTQ